MRLSVIIVNYRGWKPLRGCLDSLLTLEGSGVAWEGIVVDNASRDGRLEEFRTLYPGIRFIENEGNYGFSQGNNLGAAHATGDHLLFLNPDTRISVEAVRSMLALAAELPAASIVSSQQVSPAGRPENPFGIFPSLWTVNGLIRSCYLLCSGKFLRRKCRREEVIAPDWVSGSVILIRREDFDKLGGWDEDFWLYSEDVDLCKRAREAGGEVLLQCRPVIIHAHGGTTRSSLRLTAFFKAHVIISRHIYFRKHFRGVHHFFLQSFLVMNTLVLENLLPALAGLLLFFIPSLRRYFYLYLHMLKYYSGSIRKGSWYIDPKNIILPGGKT